ncbi:MAG: hypothetical protein Q9O24_03980 [Gammaproteobacteria bacterium]|nr:hypothetical protein [Gammaproteobacteria bacterium]
MDKSLLKLGRLKGQFRTVICITNKMAVRFLLLVFCCSLTNTSPLGGDVFAALAVLLVEKSLRNYYRFIQGGYAK